MSRRLAIRNQQHQRRLDRVCLRRVTQAALAELVGSGDYDLGIYLVDAAKITQTNREFLGHEGPTDVITFSYADAGSTSICGEILVCVDEAARQGRRYHTTWQEEVVRYIVHGVLHLQGHDDLQPGPRRLMKREEDRVVRRLRGRFGRNGREPLRW